MALEAALGLRAPALQASTEFVRLLIVQVCRRLGLDESELLLADLCARVRDVGMIGLPDSVVLAHGPLSSQEWEAVTRHPLLGAELLASLPGMSAAAQVVRGHHERWDGEGYPDGSRGDAIPLLSRVIAAVDAFAAIARDRPYRKAASVEAALEQVSCERGSQFDPRIVDTLIEVVSGEPPTAATGDQADRPRLTIDRRGAARRGTIPDVLAEFASIPAFATAHERAVRLAEDHHEVGGDLVSAIETDLALTVAVIRRAQAVDGKRPIANVADALAALPRSDLAETIRAVPHVAFPWRTPVETLLHRLRVHGQAVARAADRLAIEVGLRARDDLIAAALLHDVGKLVVLRLLGDPRGLLDERSLVPERRIREERRSLTVDHASLGSVLLHRWGLPLELQQAVNAHHSAEAPNKLATFLRLSDMIARHAHGDTVDRRVMLKLAATCELQVPALREILFDLPHSGGSHRRRAQPSPLTHRETAVLRQLAQAKLYKQIGSDLGLSTSTVRSHLHSIYQKLGVDDRAQAVLRATEMGWL